MINITDAQTKKAKEIARKRGVKVVFVNDKGEFFTNKNYALNSVKNDTSKLADVEADTVVAQNDAGEQNQYASLNANDLIAIIQESTSKDELDKIAAFEKTGKKRKTVQEALDVRLSELNQD